MTTVAKTPHVVFDHEPHRSDFVHFSDGSGLVPALVLSVDREAGTVELSPRTYGVPVTTATYTVDPDDMGGW
ncbi:MAG: hypothetical protein ACRDNK_17375 [Solirubrobacteraceae bacterium]